VPADFKIPILAYHSANAKGITYDSNDRVAFAADIRGNQKLGFLDIASADVV